MCSTICDKQFCYDGNILDSWPPQHSRHFWPPLAFHFIFANVTSYAWSSKHINTLGRVYGFIWCFYSGFCRYAQVGKCKPFSCQKGGHSPRRSMHRPQKLGTGTTPYTFILHSKMSIIFQKGLSWNYILESQPRKLMPETFLFELKIPNILKSFR